MKTKAKDQFEDVYVKESEGVVYHRCLLCWYYGENKMLDNGFIKRVEGANYNHTEACSCKNLF